MLIGFQPALAPLEASQQASTLARKTASEHNLKDTRFVTKVPDAQRVFRSDGGTMKHAFGCELRESSSKAITEAGCNTRKDKGPLVLVAVVENGFREANAEKERNLTRCRLHNLVSTPQVEKPNLFFLTHLSD